MAEAVGEIIALGLSSVGVFDAQCLKVILCHILDSDRLIFFEFYVLKDSFCAWGQE
jgi:hypothetical protein